MGNKGFHMEPFFAEPPDPNAARILREVLAWLKDDPEMRRDRERLAKVCCAPPLPVQLQGAPLPASLASRVITV